MSSFEIYREYEGDGETVELERETLHVMADEERVALVETRTEGADAGPEQLIPYQLGNHLGSVSLELDHEARVICYEEYRPYGTTAYQVGRSQAEVSAKRYRYTGKERDEESGLNYHSARYYAGWMGRWIAGDSDTESALVAGSYSYAFNSPTKYSDLDGRAPSESEALLANAQKRLKQIESFSTKLKKIDRSIRELGPAARSARDQLHRVAPGPERRMLGATIKEFEQLESKRRELVKEATKHLRKAKEIVARLKTPTTPTTHGNYHVSEDPTRFLEGPKSLQMSQILAVQHKS